MSARYPLEGSSAGDLSMQLDSSPPFFSPPDLKEMSNNLNAEPPNSSSSSATAATTARKPKPNLTIKPSPVRFSGRNAFRVWTDSDKQRRANRKATQSVNTKPQLLAKFSCVHLVEFYQRCHTGFKYQPSTNPRRVLTKPSERVGNNGYDNVNSNLIMCVNDLLFAETNSQGRTFRVLESLGQGTFGQVVSCENVDTKQKVAIKVIKNKPAYFNQALMEIRILKNLNRDIDPEGNRHLLRLLDYFVHRNHLCLVFELLSVNLYELVKTYHFRGLSCNLIRYFGDQMLDALSCLRKAKIIHCDLKPENVLLEKLSSPKIKLVDFGSACYEGQTVYCYIQSRFYRSPEVLLGLPYDSAIDMWSLGCIMAELFLGLPLYPGTSQYNQIYRIVKMQGSPPSHMLSRASKTSLYFTYCEGAETPYVLKSREQFAKDTNTPVEHNKKYPKLNANSLDELILNYAYKQESPEAIEKEKNQRRCFVHFLKGLLNFDPSDRYTPDEARLHPFVRGKPCEFLPAFDSWLRESRERANRQKLALPSVVASPSLSTSSARTASSHGVGTEISDATMTTAREGTHPLSSKAEAASSLYGHSVDTSSGGHSGGSGSGGGRQGSTNSARKDHHQQQQQQQQLNNDSATAGHSLSLSHPPSLLTLSAMAKGTVPNRGHLPSLPLQTQQQLGRGPSQSGQLPASVHTGGSAGAAEGASTDAQTVALSNAFGRSFLPPQQLGSGPLQLQQQQQQLAQQQQQLQQAQLSPHYQSQHQQFQQQPHLFPQQQPQQQQFDPQLGRNLAGYGAGTFGGPNRGAVAGLISGGGLLQLNGGSANGLYEGGSAFQQSPGALSGDGGSPYGVAEADGAFSGFTGGGQSHSQLQQQQQQSSGVLPLLDISPYVATGGPLAALSGGAAAPSAFSVHAAKLGRGQAGAQSQQQQQQQQQLAASDLIAKQQQAAAAAAVAALAAQNSMFPSTSQQQQSQLGFNAVGQAILIPSNSAVSSPASVHSMQGVPNAYAAIAGPFLSPSQETNTPTNSMSELPSVPSGFHRLSNGSESSANTGQVGIHSTNSSAIPIPSAGRNNPPATNANRQQQSPYNPQRSRRGGPGSNQPYPAGIVSVGSMPSPTTHLPSSWSHSGMMRNPPSFRHQRQPSGPSAAFPHPPVLQQQHSQPLPAANASMFSPQQQQRLFFQYQMQQQQHFMQLQQQQQQANAMNSPSSSYSSTMYPNTPSYLHPKKLVLVTPSHSHSHPSAGAARDIPIEPSQLAHQQSPAGPHRHHRQSSASSNSPLSPLSGSALPAPPVLGVRKNSLQASAAPFQPRNSLTSGQNGPQRSPSQNRNQNRPGSRTAIERSTPPSHPDEQEVVQMDAMSTNARSRAQSTANDPLSGVASPVSPAQTAGRGIVSPPSASADTPGMNAGDMLTPPANFHSSSTAYRRSSVPKVQPSSRALQSQSRSMADSSYTQPSEDPSTYSATNNTAAHHFPPPQLPRGMSDDSAETDTRDLYDVEAGGASWDPYFSNPPGPAVDSGARGFPTDSSAGGGPTDLHASPYPPPQSDQQGQDPSIAPSDPLHGMQPPPGLFEMSNAFHNASMLHVNSQGIPYALQTGHPRQFAQPNLAIDTAFFTGGPPMLPSGPVLPHPPPPGLYAPPAGPSVHINQPPNLAYAMMQQAAQLQTPPATAHQLAYAQGLAPPSLPGQFFPTDPRGFPPGTAESKAAPMQVSPVNVPYRGWNPGMGRVGPPMPLYHPPGPPGILYPPPPNPFMQSDPSSASYSTALDLNVNAEAESRASPPHVRVDGGGYDDQAGSYDYGGENVAAGSYHPVHSISGMMSGVMSHYSGS